MAYALWSEQLNHNPGHAKWFNRDRFVLSAGHGSALLYSLLHLSGYQVSLDDLKQFRKLNSKTPGHPEFGHTDGVDATTGPLGQGIAMAVGMAMAEAHLASKFNQDGFPVVDHYTYALVGDGCLMEGISYEAMSMAGHMKLGKLIVLYDSNDISLDGDLNLSFGENIQKRAESAQLAIFAGRGRQRHRANRRSDRSSQAKRFAADDYRNPDDYRLRQQGRRHEQSARRSAWQRRSKGNESSYGWHV